MELYQWSRLCHNDVPSWSCFDQRTHPPEAACVVSQPEATTGQKGGGVGHCCSICPLQFSAESLHQDRNGNNRFLRSLIRCLVFAQSILKTVSCHLGGWPCLCTLRWFQGQSTWQRFNGGEGWARGAQLEPQWMGGRSQLGRSNMSSAMTYPLTDVRKKALISALLSVNSPIQELRSNLRLCSRRRKRR